MGGHRRQTLLGFLVNSSSHASCRKPFALNRRLQQRSNQVTSIQSHLSIPSFPRRMATPILDCSSHQDIVIHCSSSPQHPYQKPTFEIPPDMKDHLQTASEHIHASRTVAFPTETVYGLGAASLNPKAIKRIYEIKNRPTDNPLIIHVSSLDMLHRLFPPDFKLSRLYIALISAFWPGPLTLLFPAVTPPPPPAPQTNAIRMPSHPLALALINHCDTPISAPSANSSGRPSPTVAHHVYNDLAGKDGLGCILDGGECGVGVESTVVNGLEWREEGGGSVDVLRPGGLGVEEISRVVSEVDREVGRTEILLHGHPWRRGESSSSSTANPKAKSHMPPSTPGLKYRHYSPRVPVFLLMPTDKFPRPPNGIAPVTPASLLSVVANQLRPIKRRLRLGILHYDPSPLLRALQVGSGDLELDLQPMSLGADSTSAANRLFSCMLRLEGSLPHTESQEVDEDSSSVDAILIEGCTNDGLGLAVMERVEKAVGGGGVATSLDQDTSEPSAKTGKFWIKL